MERGAGRERDRDKEGEGEEELRCGFVRLTLTECSFKTEDTKSS